MAKLNRGDITLHYRVSGSGPALILIGGMGMASQGWAMQAGPLSKAFTIIRFDNRGCGRSTTPQAPYTIRDMSRDVLALMDHLSIDSAHILGASMGGFIALELALAAPQRVDSLTLAHTAPEVPPLARQRIRLWLSLREAGIPDDLMALEQLIWIFPEKTMEKAAAARTMLTTLSQGTAIQSTVGFRGQAQACGNFNATERLNEILAPALLISSRDDIAIPLAHTRRLEALPGFRKTKVFDYGGHATHLIHAESFNRAVLDFLYELS